MVNEMFFQLKYEKVVFWFKNSLQSSNFMFIHIIVEYAISFVQCILDAEEAAKKLTEEAFSWQSNDNITCMVEGTTI